MQKSSNPMQECLHKNPIPCNRNFCDGVEFVHYFHCEDCRVALKPPEEKDWEKEFDNKFTYKISDYMHGKDWDNIKSFINDLLKKLK